MNIKNDSILVFVSGEPDTLDPLNYDSFVNHVVFGSVNSNLISQYKLGEHNPEIAKSWSVNSDHTKWIFKINPKVTFSDGSKITGNTVLLSWLRMAKIMKSRNSKSGFFENIVGYDNLDETSKEISGLSSTEETVTISLAKPMPNLLDKISFGLYAIVHSSHFDKNGRWIKNKENLITSGPYKISKWDNEKIILHLRSDYPKEMIHSKPLQKIIISWNHESEKTIQYDIVMGSELTGPPFENYIFQGAPPSSIFFMRILSWRNPKSVFSKKEVRIQFRNLFYKNLVNLGVTPTRSFFPLIIKNIRELSDPVVKLSTTSTSTNGEVVLPDYPLKSKVSIATANSLETTASEMGLKIKKMPISMQSLMDQIVHKKTNTTWDITGYTTGILASAPIDDVRFMFKSKEGIALPDESGNVLSELDQDNVDLQKINEFLWEQGLIWPITHYSSGLWARPELDFSQINLVLPPTSFQWVGWK